MIDKEKKIREMYKKGTVHRYSNELKEILHMWIDAIDEGLFTESYLETLEGIMNLSLEDIAEVYSLMQELAKKIRNEKYLKRKVHE